MGDIQSLFSGSTQLDAQAGRDEDMDDIVVGALNEPVRSFMRNINRPFPVKYIIDLS